MYEVNGVYEDSTGDKFQIMAENEGKFTVLRLENSAVEEFDASELDILQLRRVEEDTVTSGAVSKGVKTHYQGMVDPLRVKKQKDRVFEESDRQRVDVPLLSSIGEFRERVYLDEETVVEYDSLTKIASLIQKGTPQSLLRVTNTEWNECWEQVCDQLGGTLNEDD